MNRVSALIGSSLSAYSDSDIQKYNGKSVVIPALFAPLFSDSNVLAIFKVSSLRASDEAKLRLSLRSRNVVVKRFKLKQFDLFKRVMQRLGLYREFFVDASLGDFFRFMEGSVIVLGFEDMNHFFFFEKFMLPKLLKFRFSFFALKLNNQYFLASSSFFTRNMPVFKRSDYNLKYLKSFSYFQLLTIRSFLYFFISIKYQTIFIVTKQT